MLRLTIGRYTFRARLETELAPRTCAAMQRLLPIRSRLIHVRWSGEATWIPGGDAWPDLGYEHNTSHPAPGELLLYPGGQSEREILLPYGPTLFSSKAGQLSGNHFATIITGREQLRDLGRQVLWEGAQPIEIVNEAEALASVDGSASRPGAGPLESLVSATVRTFRQAELEPFGWAGAAKDAPVLAAVGTIARTALDSSLLQDRLRLVGVRPADRHPHENPSALLADPAWALALVLSPFKRELPALCDQVAPMAAATGVADTLLRTDRGILGINTNAYAAMGAVDFLLGGSVPKRVLIAGTGASARSVAVGLRKSLPSVEVGVVGRSPDRVAAMAAELGSTTVVDEPSGFAADLVVNATTVGQTNDESRLDFDLDSALVPGVRYFDLNNRVSALQTDALARGCATSSGVVMQILTNALRASLLSGG